MVRAIREHWPEYLMEAAGLGIFMLSAALFGTLLEYPGSWLHHTIPDPEARRVLMGLAMGGTAIAIIYSPWGKRSGAHINPAVTLTFFRLGKINGWDALYYTVFQFAGAVVGVVVGLFLLGNSFAQPPVSFVATLPGRQGIMIAFLAEGVISYVLMLTILTVTNASTLARYTGMIAGALVAIYIAFEAPLSGMSMNPARTFGSALPGHIWTALWLYFTAPTLGMLLAAQTYVSFHGYNGVKCAKLHHENDKRCIFHCAYKSVATHAEA